jgi:GNAT superfamily N-acetyltransferase
MPVEPLQPGDAGRASEAASLLNQELGAGQYWVDRLLSDAADPTAAVLLAGSRPLAGAAVARLLVPEDAEYYARFGAGATALFTSSVGSLEALAVEPALRRRGVGGLLATACLDWMRSVGAETVITVSWQSGREDSSARIFHRLGFREGRTVERFYLEESQREGWTCPVCRGPCVCAATLYTLAL